MFSTRSPGAMLSSILWLYGGVEKYKCQYLGDLESCEIVQNQLKSLHAVYSGSQMQLRTRDALLSDLVTKIWDSISSGWRFDPLMAVFLFQCSESFSQKCMTVWETFFGGAISPASEFNEHIEKSARHPLGILRYFLDKEISTSSLILKWAIHSYDSFEKAIDCFGHRSCDLKPTISTENDEIRQLLLLVTDGELNSVNLDILPDFLKVRDKSTGALWQPETLQEGFSVSKNGQLSLLEFVGEGKSGVVFKGTLNHSTHGIPDAIVAVKFYKIFGNSVPNQIIRSRFGIRVPDLVAALIEVEAQEDLNSGYQFTTLPAFYKNNWYLGGPPLLFEYVEPINEPVSEFCKYSQAWFGFEKLLDNNLVHNSFHDRNMVFSRNEQVKISWIQGTPSMTDEVADSSPHETDIVICPKMKLVDLGSLYELDGVSIYTFLYLAEKFSWKYQDISDKETRRLIKSIVKGIYRKFSSN
jgi:hypothetical protein